MTELAEHPMIGYEKKYHSLYAIKVCMVSCSTLRQKIQEIKRIEQCIFGRLNTKMNNEA